MRWMLVSLALVGPAVAQPALTPEEQAALDAAFAGPPAAAPAPAPSANPDVAVILDVAGAWFGGDAAQVGAHDPRQTGFNLQQLELTFQHAVDPYLELQANLVFSGEGVELEEAFATTLALPGGLQARAGQFLHRVGRQNTQHPHAWAFADMPLVLGALLGGEGSRGLGVEASWLAPLPWYLVLYASATNASAAHDHGAEAEADPHADDEAVELLPTARLEQFFPFDDAWSLSLGLSAQLPPADHGERAALYAADLYVRWRPVDAPGRTALSWQTEALYRADHDHVDQGLYSQLVFDFGQRWQVGGRTEWLDEAEADPRWRHSAQLSFFPSHFSRLRLQAGLDDRPDDLVPSAFLTLETLIGAHGAHRF